MSTKEEKLITAKTKLMIALGDNKSAYFTNLKQWFKQKMTFDEFDIESRKLLIPETLHLHNQFFRALLNKVDTYTPLNPVSHSSGECSSIGSGGNTSGLLASKNNRKRKRSSRPITDRGTFDPADIFDYLPDECPDIIRPPSTSGNGSPPPMPPQRFAAQELLLPDIGLVMGRLLVGAWETGLVNAEDNAAEFIVSAVQILLKNIITAILLKKKHYRVTSGGMFFYDVGCPMKEPFIRNTVTRQQIDDSPIEIDKAITSMNINRPISNDDSIFLSACENLLPMTRSRITVHDVFNALHDKNIIPSHSVLSVNVERISQCRQ